jgi:hypothetical protein
VTFKEQAMFKETMPRIYVAGKFRAQTPYLIEVNIRRAEDLALQVARLGGIPVCPHTMYRFYQHSLPDQFWIEATLSLLTTCHAMVVNQPYIHIADSTGTRGEISYCMEKPLPLFYDDPTVPNNGGALAKWISKWRNSLVQSP